MISVKYSIENDLYKVRVMGYEQLFHAFGTKLISSGSFQFWLKYKISKQFQMKGKNIKLNKLLL